MTFASRKTAKLAHKLLMLGASSLAISFATSGAFAQDSSTNTDAPSNVETVVVSGSRLVTNGANAPTPVTVVNADQLEQANPINIVAGVLDLPQFRGSSTVNAPGSTTGSNGADNLNLRGLGTTRTLVLMDGRRVIPNNNTDAVDAALIPESLVQRVDVVTGGASAAYGSDAVAGVANFILNKKFEGVKVDLQGGISTYSDDGNYKAAVTAGTSLLGGRLHVEGNVLDYFSRGIPHTNDRAFLLPKQVSFVQNPSPALGTTAAQQHARATPSNPEYILASNVNVGNAAYGGLITNTILKGTTFNSSGQPVPFNFGDPSLQSSQYTVNGQDTNGNVYNNLGALQHRDQVYGLATYDISDDLSAYVQVLGGKDRINYHHFPTFETSGTAFTIFADNAYLPASIRSTMAANHIASFTMGRVSPDLSVPDLHGETNVGQVTFGLDGVIRGSSWKYSGYAQAGRSLTTYKTEDDVITDNLYAPADAVFNSSGQIVCRSSLTNPNNGCVPANFFGSSAGRSIYNPTSNVSQAAKDYILGTAVQRYVFQQDVAEVNASGDLFDLPAATVSTAVGFAYRREHLNSTADQRSQEVKSGAGIQGYPAGIIGTLGGFERSNPQPSAGRLDVEEGYLETEVPVLKGKEFAEDLSLNAAVRYVNYSLSGGVEPWKVGAVYTPFDWLRLRYTHSVDIRAPNIGDLYKGSSQGSGSLTDPFAGGGGVGTVLSNTVGNPNLKPEIAVANTTGVVLTPEGWLSGFTASLDYFAINVHGAIAALNAQTVVNDCFQGVTSYCQFIHRGTPTATAPLGVISVVVLQGQNVGYLLAKGFDFEASYNFDVADIVSGWDGHVSMRAIVNELDELTTFTPGSALVQSAGDIGANEPKWLTTLQGQLTLGRARFFLQERIIGAGKMTNTDPTVGGQVFDGSFGPGQNHVPIVGYLNVNVSYDLTDNLNAFFNVSNVFNRDPPPVAGFSRFGSTFGSNLYSLVGRSFIGGIHYNF